MLGEIIDNEGKKKGNMNEEKGKRKERGRKDEGCMN